MRTARVVASLGTTQTLAWASSFYLPAILATPVAASLGLSPNAVFAAFSAALLLSAAIGPAVGRRIDHNGGRGVLVASNLVFATGLSALGFAQGPIGLAIAFAILGLGMGMGLYDSAFATLAGLYGTAARGPITGITLLAGFASTIGWPLTTWLDAEFGWRGACLAWAALHLLVGLPLNRFLVPNAPPPARAATKTADAVAPDHAMLVLALVFAAGWMVSTGMAAQLPRLLAATGADPQTALFAATLVGPAQVAARILEYGLFRTAHPMTMARLAFLLHPIGAAMLALTGQAIPFTLLHGSGNGLITIAKGTLPLAIFGPSGYGARTGWISLPARIGQAASPLLFGLLIDALGTGVLWITSLLYAAGLAGLLTLRRRTTT
jgi:MFS family permease